MRVHRARRSCTQNQIAAGAAHHDAIGDRRRRGVVRDVERECRTDADIAAFGVSAGSSAIRYREVADVVLRRERDIAARRRDLGAACCDYRVCIAVLEVERNRAGDADVTAACTRRCARTHAAGRIFAADVGHRGRHRYALGVDGDVLSDQRIGRIVAVVQRQRRTDTDVAAAHGGCVGSGGRVGVVGRLQGQRAAGVDDAIVRHGCARFRVREIDTDRSSDGHWTVARIGVRRGARARVADTVIGGVLVAEAALMRGFLIRCAARRARAFRAGCARRCVRLACSRGQRLEVHVAAGADVAVGGGKCFVVGDRQCQRCTDGRAGTRSRAARVGFHAAGMRGQCGERAADRHRCADAEPCVRVVVLDRETDCRCNCDTARRSRARLGGDIGVVLTGRTHYDVASGRERRGVFDFRTREVVGEIERERGADAGVATGAAARDRMRAGEIRGVVLREHGRAAGTRIDFRILRDHRFGRAVLDVDCNCAGDTDVFAAAARRCACTHAVDDLGLAADRCHHRLEINALRMHSRGFADARLRRVVAEIDRDRSADSDARTVVLTAEHRAAVSTCVGVGVVARLQRERAAGIDRAAVGQGCARFRVGDVDADRRRNGDAAVGGLGLRRRTGAGVADALFGCDVIAEAALMIGFLIRRTRRAAAAVRAACAGGRRRAGCCGGKRLEAHRLTGSDIAIRRCERLIVGDGQCKRCTDRGVFARRDAARTAGDTRGVLCRRVDCAADGHRRAGSETCVRVVVLQCQSNRGRNCDAAGGSRTGLREHVRAVFARHRHRHVAGDAGGFQYAGVLDFGAREIVGEVERERCTDAGVAAAGAACFGSRAGYVSGVVLRDELHRTGSCIDDRVLRDHRFCRAVLDVDRNRACDADVFATGAGDCRRAHAVDGVLARDGGHRSFEARAFRVDRSAFTDACLRRVVAEIQCNRCTDTDLRLSANRLRHRAAIGIRMRIGVVGCLQTEVAAGRDRASVDQRCARFGIGDVDRDGCCDSHIAIGCFCARCDRAAGIAGGVLGRNVIAERALVIGFLVGRAAAPAAACRTARAGCRISARCCVG